MQEGEHLLIWHTSVKAIINNQHLYAWNIFSNEIADLIAHTHQDLFYWISKQSNIMIQLFEFYKKHFLMKTKVLLKGTVYQVFN